MDFEAAAARATAMLEETGALCTFSHGAYLGQIATPDPSLFRYNPSEGEDAPVHPTIFDLEPAAWGNVKQEDTFTYAPHGTTLYKVRAILDQTYGGVCVQMKIVADDV